MDIPAVPGVPRTGKQLIALVIAVAIVMAIFHFVPILKFWERFPALPLPGAGPRKVA